MDASANDQLDKDWEQVRKRAMGLLQREAELEELGRLVGMDALAHEDRLLMQAAKMIREDFLHQNAFDERDSYTSLRKQLRLLKILLHYFDEAKAALKNGAALTQLLGVKALDEIARAKLIPEDSNGEFVALERKISAEIGAIQCG